MEDIIQIGFLKMIIIETTYFILITLFSIFSIYGLGQLLVYKFIISVNLRYFLQNGVSIEKRCIIQYE